MGRIPDLRQIKKEDFDNKDQSMVDKLAFPFNNFMQQVINVFKNGIDFTNLNQQKVTFTISVDSTGTPISTVTFKNLMTTKVIGITCISAVNTTTNIRFPSAAPFMSYTENSGLVTITNIAGLPIPSGQTNSDVYTFTILTINDNLPNN